MKFAPLLFTLGLLALVSACSQEAPKAFRPLPLARGGVPTGWIAGKPIVSVLEAPEGWLRIPEVIPPSAWIPAAWPGIYQASVRLPGIGSPPGRPGPHELRVGERELTGQPFSQDLLEPGKFADGDFASFGDELFLVDRSGELVRGPMQYIAWIERGFRDEGRMHVPGITCDGVLLLPGERLRLDLPSLGDGGAELVFGVAAFGSPKSGNDEPPELVLRVERGGQTLHTESLAVELLCSTKPVRIDLPNFEGGELTIVIEGELALALIQNPVLSPLVDSVADVDVRPDLVLFLADTFRADNLAQWGGDPALAPTMNAFGESGLVLTDAHAPASWTLPSQASLLSGVYSPQIGLVGSNHAMPSQFDTLARVLSEAGYRTAAVTDGLFVSERYGFDQGFEVFLESEERAGFDQKTQQRVQSLLDADDGRPLFLFVQTYRVHTPYFASAQAMAEHPELFGSDPEPADWEFTKLFARAGKLPKGTSLRDNLDPLRRLYLGGVADLDRAFGGFLQQLESAGLRDAFVVLTSDHGEAFGEHSGWAHGSSVYEEQVGIPLVIRGPGIQPEVLGGPVSLVDVTMTLAELAGAEPGPLWVGRSLLGEERALGPVFSFESPAGDDGSDTSDFAIYDGRQKIIGSIAGQAIGGEASFAFQLSEDPDELRDLAASGTWPKSLIDRWSVELARATRLVAEPKPLALSEAELIEFRAMGYFGD